MSRSFGKPRQRAGVGAGALFLVGVGTFSVLAASACEQVLGLDKIDYDVADGGTAVTRGPDASTPADSASGETDAFSPDAPGTAPATLATLASSPGGAGAVQGVAIDDARLYWVTAGSNGYVLSALKDGGGMTTIATEQPYPLDIAVLGTSVYWSVRPAGAGPQCMAMVASTPGNAPDGGDAGPTCVTSSPDTTVRMTLGGGGIVLLSQGTGPNANDEYIGFSTVGAAYTNVETQGPSSAVTATTQQGFLGNGNGFHIDEIAFPGLTFGASLCTSSCGGTVIEDMTTDVAVQNVLWITEGGGVHTTPIHVNGAVGTQFVVLPATPQRVARDSSYAYVTTTGQWVFAVPLAQGSDGGVSVTLSSEETSPFGIVVDDTSVYWGNADGTIRRTSVPPP